MKLENKRCREGDKNLSAVRVADLVKQYGRDFKAVNGMYIYGIWANICLAWP